MIEVTGKTIYVFNGLLDGLLSSSRPLNKNIPALIEQVLSVDRMSILGKLFDNEESVKRMAFDRLCLSDR